MFINAQSPTIRGDNMGRPRKAIVEYRIYELSRQFPIILLDGENWHISDIKNKRLHFHNCFEIGMCHTDSGTMVFEDANQPFYAGDITCVPKQIAHTTYSSKGTKSLWSYLFIDFQHFINDSIAKENMSASDKVQDLDFYLIFNQEKYPRLYFYISNIFEEMRSKRTGYKMVVGTLVHTLYYYLMRLKDSLDEKNEAGYASLHQLAPALNYINDNYSSRLYIDSLAEMCNLSTTHFRRTFLSVMGYTPHYFINKLRIDNACELLLSTSNNIISISEAVGFFSVSSFNRCFMQMLGVTPKFYRNNHGVEQRPANPKIMPYSGWTSAEDLKAED